MLFRDIISANPASNEDVSETMYKDTIKIRNSAASQSKLSQFVIETKVNRICDAFLAVFEKPSYKGHYLQNIITSHASKTPPDLETALGMIAEQQGKSAKRHFHFCNSNTF